MTPTETTLAMLPDVTALEEQGLVLAAQAEELTTITTRAEFERAGAQLVLVKTYIKRINEATQPAIEAAHAAHKRALELRGALLGTAHETERALNTAVSTWEAAERRRLEAERAAAEAQRMREEAAAAARAAAATAAAQQAAETAMLEQAAAAEASGDTATAERLLAQPVAVAPVAPTPVFTPPATTQAAPVVSGLGFTWYYSSEVVELMDLVQAVAAGTQPLSTLQGNMTTLNGLARSLKDEFRVPGVKLVKDRRAGATGRRS